MMNIKKINENTCSAHHFITNLKSLLKSKIISLSWIYIFVITIVITTRKLGTVLKITKNIPGIVIL